MKNKVLKSWDYEIAKMNDNKVGRQFLYPDSQIVFLSVMKVALGNLSYRNLDGFSGLFFREAPDYSRINRRMRKLSLGVLEKINRETAKAKTEGRIIEVVLDATGVQINGKYVWIDEKKQEHRRRDWRKLHVAIDSETRQILAIKVLEKDENEGSHRNTADILGDTLENMHPDSAIARLYGDGAYDNEANFGMLDDMGIDPVIRIREPSRVLAWIMSRAVRERKRREYFSSKRNRIALEQRDWGRYVEEKRYGRRSGLEGVIGSFKRFFREFLFSRIPEMVEREVLAKALVWNIMV